MPRVCISTGCLPRLEGCRFYELASVVRMMKRFLRESNADGFEFVLLPEWYAENPPLTPTSAPPECEKHSVDEVLEAVASEAFPILSVHANRDIGNYLCSGNPVMVEEGRRLVSECLGFARKVHAGVCVLHFWDTWKERFDLTRLKADYCELQKNCPDVEASVENVPTKFENKTPFQLWQTFDHGTLDLKWASMYNEFDAYLNDVAVIDNVHVQGKHQDGKLVPTTGNLDFEAALDRIRTAGYSGVFTVELEGTASCEGILDYVERLKARMG